MKNEIHRGNFEEACSKSGGTCIDAKDDATQIKMSIGMDQDEEINRLSNRWFDHPRAKILKAKDRIWYDDIFIRLYNANDNKAAKNNDVAWHAALTCQVCNIYISTLFLMTSRRSICFLITITRFISTRHAPSFLTFQLCEIELLERDASLFYERAAFRREGRNPPLIDVLHRIWEFA